MPIIGTDTGSLTLARGISVLEVLRAADEPLGLAEISRRVALSRPAVHRLLSTLVMHGLVDQEEDRSYRLGWAFLGYAEAWLRRTRLADIAPPVARRLRDATQETVTIQVRAGTDRIVIYEAEGPQEVHRRVGVGTRLPLYAGASGLAILAHLPAADQARMLEAYPGPTARASGPEGISLMARLTAIRASGVAHSEAETVEGASAVAAPVWGSSDEVVGSIAVSGPTSRWANVVASAEPLVRSAADELSRRLGHAGALLDPALYAARGRA